MAWVFLSYDHEDAAKARVVARSLEIAGHEVWWDRHIRGGAQYAQEIEQAIERSDAVVVLWSRRSVVSEWVRDEAAAGRDRQRLVPARIDPIDPPMGFRQFQTVDLTDWKGRKRAEALTELDRAVAALGQTKVSRSIKPGDRPGFPGRLIMTLVMTALLALVAAGLWAWQPWQQRPEAPVVTVEARDASEASRAMANSLFVQLGSLQASRADLLQLAEPQAGLDPALILRVAAQRVRDGPGSASVTLVDGRNATLLWSKEFNPGQGTPADLRQQVAYATAHVLNCAAEVNAAGSKGPRGATYRVFLNGCAEQSDPSNDAIAAQVPTFRRVADEAPEFESVWSHLLLASIGALQLTDLKDPQLRRQLRLDIEAARRIDPDIVEAHMAEAWLQPPRPIIGWMRHSDRAVEIGPTHPAALLQRAAGLIHVGRMAEAVADSRKAVQFNPLSPGARAALVSTLAEAGEKEAAEGELREIERLWPGSISALVARFYFDYDFGDPRRALEIMQSGKMAMSLRPSRVSFLQAKIEKSQAATERAIRHAQQEFVRDSANIDLYLEALAQFGRHREAVDHLISIDPAETPGLISRLFGPALGEVRRDPRFMAIAKRFGLIDYWRESRKWPDFCSRPDLPYDCKSEAARTATRKH